MKSWGRIQQKTALAIEGPQLKKINNKRHSNTVFHSYTFDAFSRLALALPDSSSEELLESVSAIHTFRYSQQLTYNWYRNKSPLETFINLIQ